MRHIKNLSHVAKPVLASEGPNIFDCLSALVDSGDVEVFKDCLAEKFNKSS